MKSSKQYIEHCIVQEQDSLQAFEGTAHDKLINYVDRSYHLCRIKQLKSDLYNLECTDYFFSQEPVLYYAANF